MSAHLSTLRRHAQQQGLQLVVCASHGVTRYAVIRDWWHMGLPVLWYRTLGEVGDALRAPGGGYAA